MKPDSRDGRSLFDIIDSSMFEFIKNDKDEAIQILKDSGLDHKEEKTFGKKVIRMLRFKNQAISNKKNDDFLIAKAVEKLKTYVKEHLDQPSEVLISLLRKKAPDFQFRSLDKLGDAEIREILNDVDLARLMEEIEKDQKG